MAQKEEPGLVNRQESEQYEPAWSPRNQLFFLIGSVTAFWGLVVLAYLAWV